MPKEAVKSNPALAGKTLDVSVHFTTQQVHELFDQFDATNNNGLYVLYLWRVF
jgi:hypothetical protein